MHDMKAARSVGVGIRTISIEKRRKILSNANFAEIGLSDSVPDKIGPKLIVQTVDKQITSSDFMEKLYKLTFKVKRIIE